MYMQNKDEKQDKAILKTSITTPNELYEMVFDRTENKTSFFKIDKSGKLECFLEEVQFGAKLGEGVADILEDGKVELGEAAALLPTLMEVPGILPAQAQAIRLRLSL